MQKVNKNEGYTEPLVDSPIYRVYNKGYSGVMCSFFPCYYRLDVDCMIITKIELRYPLSFLAKILKLRI